MRLAEAYKKVIMVREKLTTWVDKISEVFSNDDVVLDLMAMRNYQTMEMYEKLSAEKVFRVDNLGDAQLFCSMTEQDLADCGLVSGGMFLLGGRYCLPIRDVMGRVMAVVGYYPSERKYVTTPAFGFSKAISFYGMEHIEYYDSPYVVLCEGIYDTLSLQAWGIHAIGNQGLDLSAYKGEMLRRYKRIVAIPDADKSGRSVNPYFARSVNKQGSRVWRIPTDNCFAVLRSGVKDIDDYLKDEGRARSLDAKLRDGKYLISLD